MGSSPVGIILCTCGSVQLLGIKQTEPTQLRMCGSKRSRPQTELEGYRRRTGRARGGVGPTGEGEVTRVDGGSSEDEMHGAQAAGRRREGHAGDLVHVGKKAQGGINKK